MAINLPNSPTNGQTVTLGNKTLVYSTSLSVWQIQSSPSGATVTTSDTAPTSPSDGDMWFDSATLNTFIYYADGSSNQWVKANPSGSTGPQGIQGVAGAAGADGADGASGGNGIATIVADMAGLIALSGMSAGAQAYVTSNNQLYFYNGSGWYLIATVQNDAPSAITGVDGTYALDMTGNATTITAVSTDPEGFALTWSYATSGLGSIATVSQTDNVFTITPSTVDANAGTFTLTISATDGVNGAVNAVTSMSLAFTITNSKHTSFLLSANAAGGNGQYPTHNITDSSNSNRTTSPYFLSNNTNQGSFSPQRSGGYSVEFDGNDYLKVADSSDFHVSSSADFTLEAWVYLTNLSTNNQLVDTRPSGANGDYFTIAINTSNKIYMFSQSAYKLTSAASVPLDEWVHVSYVRSSNTGRWYINGTADSNTWTDNIAYHTSSTGADWWIGARQSSSGSYFVDAKIRDFRFVNGTAIVPPSGGPSEALTAVANTKLLACSLPYLADASASPKAITVSGDPKTVPAGPYDFGTAAVSDGGSVTLNDNDYIEMSAFLPTSGSFTVEYWIYPKLRSGGTTNRGIVVFSGNTTGLQLGFLGGNWYTAMTGSVNTTAVVYNAWHHWATTFDGTNYRSYLNGTEIHTLNNTAYPSGSGVIRIGERKGGGMTTTHGLGGYSSLSDFRVTNKLVYTGAFTPPTAALEKTQSSGTNIAAITGSECTCLLKFQEAKVFDKSQSTNLELDGSTTGHATRKDGAAWAGTFSTYFGGSTGDNAFARKFENLGSNFTVECWAYAVGTGTQVVMASIDDIGSWSGAGRYMFVLLGGKYQLYIDGGTSPGSQTTAATLNTWQHVAVTKSGSTVTYYLDGIQNGSFTNSLDLTNPSGISIGSGPNNGWIYNWGGYLQDLRISRSVRYTANFTPPTAPLEG
jgi:hypothetical protein